MNRVALLLSYPGELGSEGYCEGVNQDMKAYYSFLTSPLGGGWFSSEIFQEPKPRKSKIESIISKIQSYDYSLIVFCGHGWYSSESSSTILQLNHLQEFDSLGLRSGATKRTIILDCCRVVSTDYIAEGKISAMEKAIKELDFNRCRKAYNNQIEKCSKGIVILHSCDIGETSGDSSIDGGYYSNSLIMASENWKNEIGDNQQTNASSIKSVVQVHYDACPRVRMLSGSTQNPQVEKPRSTKYFPFAVIA